MTVSISAAEAKRLGIDVKAKPKRTRKVAAGAGYHTRCRACGDEFTTQAAEDRHLIANPDHRNYQLVLKGIP